MTRLLHIEYNPYLTRDYGVLAGGRILVTPPIGENYWLLRVALSDNQAIVAFPKFLTIGIGFQHELDWNTNLPYTCTAEEIYNHIKHNKGDDSISQDDCIAAICRLQKEARRYQMVTQQQGRQCNDT